MRLIDADKLTESIKDTYCDGCDHLNYIRCRACETDDALSAIDAEDEVDAIPVEWLEEQAKDNYDYSGTLIRGLLSEWQKEQEAR